MPELPPSEQAKSHLDPIIAKFERPSELYWATTVRIGVGREALPVPWLAHLALVQVVGCEDLGRGDKTLRRVPFRYDGIEAMLTQEKFGTRLYLGPGAGDHREPDELGHEIVKKLVAIVRVVERDVLKGLADERLAQGCVTIMNQAARLRSAYDHFRDEAAGALVASEPDDTKEIGDPGGEGGIFPGVSRYFERLELGSFNAVAAINAYFSWLEHVLVLALGFTDVDPGDGTLMKHIGDKWAAKFRRVFDLQDADANRVHGRLHEIAEAYRNPYAHGGFDKLGATIGIHIDGIGTIPACLTDGRRSPQFELYPFGRQSFADIVSALDGVDEFLRDGPRRLAVRYAESGMDVPFDDQSRAEFRAAMSSAERFEQFLAQRSQMLDDYLN